MNRSRSLRRTQLTWQFPKTLWSICCAGCVAFAGCAGIGQSLRVNSTVLVKVPIDAPIPAGAAASWEFRHVLEAPRDLERRGEWYVAWNNNKPFHFGGLLPCWPRLFSRAPEIASATYQAFGAYPVLIEPNRTFGRIASKQPPEPKPGQPVPSQYGSGVKLVINTLPVEAWSDNRALDPNHPGGFIIDPMWHLDDKHSQLAAARDHLERPGEGIIIGHVDNGLDARHPAAPFRLQRGDSCANAVGLLDYAQKQSRHELALRPGPIRRTESSLLEC
jgi:hypothetical protein